MMPIYAELIDPVYRRATKVINRSILIDLSFYLVIAVAGYLSAFDKTEKIVVERKSLNGKPDIPCLISIIGVMLSILVAFPCSYNPTRFQIFELFLCKENGEFSDRENYIVTFVFILLTWVLSVVYPQIDKVFSILGGLCATTLDFAIPTYCFVKLSKEKWSSCKNLSSIIAFGLLSLVGYVNVVIIIILMATGCNTMKEFNGGTCNQ